jgi:uncharacterized membrane protein YgcG
VEIKSETSRYIVTLKDIGFNESFYADMEECECSSECIPNREVECSRRLETGPNTIYYLSDEEAEKLKEDQRVLDVKKLSDLPKMFPASVKPEDYFYSGPNRKYWKSPSTPPNISSMDNHSLLRCAGENTPSNWGGGFSDTKQVTGSYSSFWTGMNVDVITLEVDPDNLGQTLSLSKSHVDFKNRFGTSSRIIPYNWEQNVTEKTTINGISNLYANYPDKCLLDHASGTLSCAGGIRSGFAKDANLYVVYGSYDDSPNKATFFESLEYIRQFHRKKVNSSQKNSYGHINPTVAILEFQNFHLSRIGINSIESIRYRGTVISRPEKGWDIDVLEEYKLNPFYIETGIDNILISNFNNNLENNSVLFSYPFADNNLRTGDRVVYEGSSINGLVNGQTYYLIKTQDSTFNTRFKFAESYQQSLIREAISISVASQGFVSFYPVTGEKNIKGLWSVHHNGNFLKEDETIVSLLSDIEATVNSGVHVTCAMGNGCHTRAPWNSSVNKQIDYDNYYQVYSDSVSFDLSSGSPNSYMILSSGSTGRFYYNRPIGPEGVHNAINVSALNTYSKDQLESYSNKGPATSVCSPGGGQFSTYNPNWGNDDGWAWGPFSGTSAATPTAAGILACLLEYNMANTIPTNLLWTPAQAKQALCSTYAKQNSIRDISYVESNTNANKFIVQSDPDISDSLFSAAATVSSINRRLHDTPNAIVQLPANLRRERYDSATKNNFLIDNNGNLIQTSSITPPPNTPTQTTRPIRVGFGGRNNGGNAKFERQQEGTRQIFATGGGGGAGFYGGGGANAGGGGGGGSGLAREDASVANNKTRQGGNSGDGFVRIWINEKADGSRDTWNQDPLTR